MFFYSFSGNNENYLTCVEMGSEPFASERHMPIARVGAETTNEEKMKYRSYQA